MLECNILLDLQEPALGPLIKPHMKYGVHLEYKDLNGYYYYSPHSSTSRL